MQQIISAAGFINRLTQGKVDAPQVNRTVAYLRAKGIAFYDEWSKEHCIIYSHIITKKAEIMIALNHTLLN